ncbi:Lactococcin-G-processing and transport ATP-binding protein LagD [Usitatibacter rugosus]|uniref:Cyclolysin secretion/processing ATP-binding protein CyaB n=1 Tax=Usitatibacter rugosus TaxID=2732067 RepID=A0A6M4GSQ9_9PROT|nr:NHLP family bacteriocin export ABC transporter peptidase/permease/ATPase subunit [Usitatibacter rugosus]QJR09878.1 Lactococcin-G-processing and transport ATP-binding protein LagD [Usitatibacter rugosus]
MAADGSLNTAIRRVPAVLQLESVECGAAALAMVLAHHGRWVPLEVLRVACGVSRDGSKAGNILRAARTFGLIARGFKKEPRDLAELPFPSILFWNFNHFVVLEGFEDGQAWISDPALGRRKVGSEEFDSAFTGVVLTFERGPEFQPGGDKPSIMRSLAQYLEGMHPSIAFAIVLGVLLVPPGLLLPWFMGRFVDEVLVGKMGGVAGPLLIGLGLAALARSALLWIQAHLLMDTYGRAAAQASRRFVGHALSLPMEFFVQRSPGEIASRVDLNERVAETISNDLAHLALSLLTASFYLILMVQLEAGLAIIVVACLALELFVWRVLAERTAEISRQLSTRAGKLAGAASGALANIEGIKAAGLEPVLFARWMGLQVQLSNATVQAQRLSLTLGQVPGLLSLVAYLAVLGLGSLRIIEGTFTVGNLVAFQVLLAGFTAPVHALFAATQHMQTLTGDLARLDDVLHYKGDAKVTMTRPKQEAPLEKAATLEFRGVTFGYNRGEPPLVEDFSLTLKAGQRVALVGASGCGKSTLGRLAVGLYSPWQGEVLFDGKPRSEWDRVALARSVAYVDQDVVLFQGSVRDNLALWDPRIGEDAIREALRDAALEQEILGRPGALEAPLQEGARNLSGGQRQRLEIARALAASPSILILDEATSALDPLTEATVDASLKRRGIACLVIAHRLSTVRAADEIVVLDTGRVVERGRHEDLVKIPDGRYAALVAMDAVS